MKKENAEITIKNFLTKIRHYYPANEDEILAAYNLASEAHKSQTRESGRPYITHPVVVADILVDLGLDVPCICAALLHDTVEDTYVTDGMLREKFGDEVAHLIRGVTKLKSIDFQSREEEQAENVRRMFFAMSKDIRVLLIKLADRLHNMRSLEYKTVNKQALTAKETLDIYAPLAGRLGISQIKCELEDLSLKFLDREMYDFFVRHIAATREERREIAAEISSEIERILAEEGLKAEVWGRTKHFYSIFKKMKNQAKTLEEIYDLTAFRIIVDNVQDCYNALGFIHKVWHPIPGRIKDYVAAPKPNKYQSLHTSVVTSHGVPIEIQIRTQEMHRIAEFGVAAHWKYKEDVKGDFHNDESLKWIQDVLNYGNELSDSKEFLNVISYDISVTNEIYVFTPKHDVRVLIAGATALDFAYSIHSEVGNKCIGAKVNNKICHLERVLETGDTVEILTNPQSKGPSRDWLKIVKTASARVKIRQFFRREMKEENIKTGKGMLEHAAASMGHTFSALLVDEAVQKLFKRYCFTSLDEMYASVGYGGISINQILLKLISANKDMNSHALFTKEKGAVKRHGAVIVKGMGDLLIRFSRCCTPVPGDSIIGYISRGRGVTVHRSDCAAVKTLEEERLISAEWAPDGNNATYLSFIQIISEDKGEVFAEITKVIAAERLPLISINARKDKNGSAITVVSVEIKNQNELEFLMKRLRSLPNTIEVNRTIQGS